VCHCSLLRDGSNPRGNRPTETGTCSRVEQISHCMPPCGRNEQHARLLLVLPGRLRSAHADTFIGAVGVLFQMGSAPVGCVHNEPACRHDPCRLSCSPSRRGVVRLPWPPLGRGHEGTLGLGFKGNFSQEAWDQLSLGRACGPRYPRKQNLRVQ